MKKVLLSVLLVLGLLMSSCSLMNKAPITLSSANYPNDLVYPGDIILGGYNPGVTIDTWFQSDSTPTFGHVAGNKMAIEIYNSHSAPATFTITVDNPPPLSFNQGMVNGDAGANTVTGSAAVDWSQLPTTDSLGAINKYLTITGDPVLYQITSITGNSLTVSPNLILSATNTSYSIEWYRTTANATGSILYENAPAGNTWLKVPTTVIVKAHQLLSVPISFCIPLGAASSNYDMRITVTDTSNATQIMSNEQIRFLVAMETAP